MPSAPLNLSPDPPRQFRVLVEGVIQVYLDDVNSMLRIRPNQRGGCAFPIALTLLDVVGGLSTIVYPSRVKPPNSGQRFEQLLAEHYPWSAEPQSAVPKEVGPFTFYKWFRNPQTHALSLETGEVRGLTRMSGGASRIGVIRQLPPELKDWSDDTLQELDGETRPFWLSATLAQREDRRVWLTVEALYWGVRRLIESVTRSPERMEVAGWFLREHDRAPAIAGHRQAKSRGQRTLQRRGHCE